ncbi:MAG: FAD-dependent oxidoreductase [Bacteroidia bacterium]
MGIISMEMKIGPQKNVSLWEATSPMNLSFNSFSGHEKADVVVIGGGISGITTAMLLSEAGKKVILLEARRIGMGTTGNSTGNLYAVVDEHLSVIKKRWNGDVMKALVQSRTSAIELIESVVKKYAIQCEFARHPFSYFAERLNAESEKFIHDEYESLLEAGLQPLIVNELSLPFKIEKGLSAPNQAQFNPLKYVSGIAKNISQFCYIYENSPVIDINTKDGIVKTIAGQVKAEHIVMATHTPKGFSMVQTRMLPVREFGVAAELQKDVVPAGMFWSLGEEQKHSVRSYKANGKNYVLSISEKFKTGQNNHTLGTLQKLEGYLTNHFPIGEITHRWGAQAYRSADGIPYIGKYKNKLFIMTGFALDGLVYGTLGAMIISDLLCSKENQWSPIYNPHRFTPLKSAKRFFIERTNNFAQYMKDFPGIADTESIDSVPSGEGRIIEKDGEKLAVFRAENDEVKIVSAVCTHMKCIVRWNSAEQSWDCPCHASRFDTDGKVIEGPALHNLATKII